MDGLSALPMVFSLEHDFFPQMIQMHPTYGFKVGTRLWDIGTPERYGAFCEEFVS